MMLFQILKQLSYIRSELSSLRKEVRSLRMFVVRPHALSVIVSKEDEMQYKFEIVLPVPPANQNDWSEIASGELTVKIGEAAPLVFVTTKDKQETGDRHFADEAFIGAQGTWVELSFAYIDDAGNKGSATTELVELRDTIPPVAPERIGAVVTAEVPDA